MTKHEFSRTLPVPVFILASLVALGFSSAALAGEDVDRAPAGVFTVNGAPFPLIRSCDVWLPQLKRDLASVVTTLKKKGYNPHPTSRLTTVVVPKANFHRLFTRESIDHNDPTALGQLYITVDGEAGSYFQAWKIGLRLRQVGDPVSFASSEKYTFEPASTIFGEQHIYSAADLPPCEPQKRL